MDQQLTVEPIQNDLPTTTTTGAAPPLKRANIKGKPPFKRPRFTNSQSTRHGGTSYTKTVPNNSLQIVPRRSHFPIFVSNYGCKSLAHWCYRTIQGKDFRLSNAITQLQLEYVLTMSYTNRIVQCALHHGYAIPEYSSLLKQHCQGIQLPSVLADYIESIGRVLVNGISYVPFAGDYQHLFPLNNNLQRDPADTLYDAQRAVPDFPWSIDTEWILHYNDSTTRASRSGIAFRTVNNACYDGRLEMLVSYTGSEYQQLLPKAPVLMSEGEAHLGACYQFRDWTTKSRWLGDNKELLFDAFTTIPFDARVFLTDTFVAAFKSAPFARN